MTISELSARIDRAQVRLDAEIEAQAAIAGNDIVALVTNRVVQSGKASDGAPFTPYSTTELPAFFYFNKSRNAGGEAKVRAKAKKKEPISYKEFRALNSLNTSPKNFEFAGSMWRGFGVLGVQRTPSGAKITIGGRNKDAADKISYNSEREGKSIIKPSEQEVTIIQVNLNKWAQSVING